MTTKNQYIFTYSPLFYFITSTSSASLSRYLDVPDRRGLIPGAFIWMYLSVFNRLNSLCPPLQNFHEVSYSSCSTEETHTGRRLWQGKHFSIHIYRYVKPFDRYLFIVEQLDIPPETGHIIVSRPPTPWTYRLAPGDLLVRTSQSLPARSNMVHEQYIKKE